MHESASLPARVLVLWKSTKIEKRRTKNEEPQFQYNTSTMKLTLTVVLALSLAALSACKQSKGPDQAQNVSPSSHKSDATEKKLLELAGSGATDCGSPKSQQPADVEPASKCALQAAQNKQAFYVRYDLPGMTTAMAGNAQGKLFAVQAGSTGEVDSTPCPAEIRQAPSGRVTCYTPGSMGSMPSTGGVNPHAGGMAMPPATGANPHGGNGGMMSIPNITDANPHQGSTKPSHPGPQSKQPKP